VIEEVTPALEVQNSDVETPSTNILQSSRSQICMAVLRQWRATLSEGKGLN